MDLLSIELDHLAVVATMPLHHRDPFDRLLIAQAMVEQVPILGMDSAFDAYSIQQLSVIKYPHYQLRIFCQLGAESPTSNSY
ncbi:hypothetical protein [Nostoc mirabile]|uniref:hypothetical protein n=1 Tax=Nostoc mirabile TaxID=2907820 RepID=UPI0027E0D86D|nr:hypothetical protein [Nostoc mirabile]